MPNILRVISQLATARSLDGHDDLPELAVILEIAVGFHDLVEFEDAIDDGFEGTGL